MATVRVVASKRHWMALGVFPLELCGGLWVMGDHDLAATPLCSVRWCGRDGPPMQPAADQSASQLRFGDAFSSITHDSMALDNGGRVNRADARLLRDYPRAEPIPNPTLDSHSWFLQLSIILGPPDGPRPKKKECPHHRPIIAWPSPCPKVKRPGPPPSPIPSPCPAFRAPSPRPSPFS